MAIFARRPQARRCVFSALSIERDTREFHPMVNEAEAKLFSNLPLQGFKLGIDKFDHLAGFNIDQMVMMCLGCRLIARTTVAEIVAIEDSGLFEETDGPIDSGNRNSGVDCGGAHMECFDIRMVFGFGKNARNNSPLLGNAQALFGTKRFDINASGHGGRRAD